MVRGVRQGVFWGILIYLTSSLNDVLMRLLGERLHFIEIAFFRFLFSVIVVAIPMFFSKSRHLFKTSMHGMHFLRGLIGAIALSLCCLSVLSLPLAENTIILFSESLFVLPLSWIILKEKIKGKAIVATLLGFVGLLVIFNPKAANLNLLAIVPTIAAFLFAVMDILVKKMIDRGEPQLTLLFYFGLYTTLLSGIFVPFVWQAPTATEMFYIFLLGLGANLIQVFIYLAYRATEASTLSPIRYIELPFAITFGYFFFEQIPNFETLMGALLIILSTFVVSRE